ncbi:aldo/keto reductase [Companilactobacillus sp. DQM5]|uniref:aldo/keto reductase n=1 Tax=Companilactobacillus sp. DQM5 TaxID=3463359 RepID=UPI0040583477
MSIINEFYELSNGVSIPKLGFGTWKIPGGQLAYDATKQAIDLGYRNFDTAKKYENESSIGQAIKDSRIKRKDIFISSKLPPEVMTFQEVLDEFEKSIENLKTDYIDLYLLQAPWPWNDMGNIHDRDNMEVWKAFEKLYKDKKVRAIGVANFGVLDLENVIKDSEISPMVNQIRHFVGFTQPKIMNFCVENNILMEAYSPLATGNLLTHSVIEEIANKYQVTPAQIAIRYCIQHGTLPLPKAIGKEHIEENAKVDFTILPEDMKRLEKLPDTDPDSNIVK